ncbi:AraC family transcriptional regulator [Bacillus haynesii]|uniref:AraC family transcriptional regulator n=1 Tax=Bacillus haynesii TaxID=1925021 RepID=UPI003D1E6A45
MQSQSTQYNHVLIIEKLLSLIESNYQTSLTLESMAREVHLSPYYLNRLFKSAIGVPPIEYLNAIRIEKSKHLLKSTNLRIIDICLEVGYESIPTFTNKFKATVGLTPSQYRKGNIVSSPKRNDTRKIKVSGEAILPNNLSGDIFIGAFKSPIPKGIPIGCTILSNSDAFDLFLPKGTYYILGIALPSAQIQTMHYAKMGPFSIDRATLLDPLQFQIRNDHRLPVLLAIPTRKGVR